MQLLNRARIMSSRVVYKRIVPIFGYYIQDVTFYLLLTSCKVKMVNYSIWKYKTKIGREYISKKMIQCLQKSLHYRILKVNEFNGNSNMNFIVIQSICALNKHKSISFFLYSVHLQIESLQWEPFKFHLNYICKSAGWNNGIVWIEWKWKKKNEEVQAKQKSITNWRAYLWRSKFINRKIFDAIVEVNDVDICMRIVQIHCQLKDTESQPKKKINNNRI